MAFQQLHYTSCRDGLAGYSGYQFCAVTPGTPPAVMREVEELTVYQPPPWLLVSPRLDEPDVYPVVLSHAVSASTDATITTHVVFAGTDYSGRPGNYFAHALVTATPEPDFGPVLPAELWGAEFWQRHRVGGPELPELSSPPVAGVIDPLGVQAFLDAGGMAGILGELLTAVNCAMAGAPPVLLACRDATESAWWIAAVSYLLGGRLGRQMTFTTYSHRPGSALFHLIGILSDTLPPDATTGFQLFELTSGLTPGDDVHPLAGLLADTGVLAASALWRQALAFASGTENSLDDWLPVVAMAAALLGRSLAPAERNALVGWADGALSRLPTDVADVVRGVVLAQSAEALPTGHLIELLGLTERAGAPARAVQMEDLLIERAADLIGEDPSNPELARLLHCSPAVLRRLLARLEGEPSQVAETVLAGPAGALIERIDVADHPSLTEAWLLRSAAQGSLPPLRALDEIADTRAWAGRSPRIDLALLTRLWPVGCPPDQFAELLGLVADRPPDDALDWLTEQLSELAAHGEPNAGWYRLAGAVVGHPIMDLLPAPDFKIIRNAARAGPLLARADAQAPNGDADVFAELFALYLAADDSRMPGLLLSALPALLAGAVPLGAALRDCPAEVALAFGHELKSRLAGPRADVALATAVFTALAHPDVIAQPLLSSHLGQAVEQVRAWRRRNMDALGQALDSQSAAGEQFQSWRRPRHPTRLWRRPP